MQCRIRGCRGLKVFFSILLCVAAVLPEAFLAEAATFHVDIRSDELDVAHGGGDDDTGLSLREAVLEANGISDDVHTIVLPTGVFRFTRTGDGENDAKTGDLDIKSDVTILGGNGDRDDTVIDADELDRVLQVFSGHTLELRNLTIRNGEAPCGSGSPNGGGIRNSGSLVLLNVAVANNKTGGNGGCYYGSGDGGGIYSDGNLSIDSSVIAENETGDCRGAYSDRASPGHGGGIAVRDGTLDLVDTSIEDNVTGGGVDGIDRGTCHSTSCRDTDGGEGHDGGKGGGLYLSESSARIRGCFFERNWTGRGGRGGKGYTAGDGTAYFTDGGDGGDGGHGAGIYIHKGTVEINHQPISGEKTGWPTAGPISAPTSDLPGLT